MDPASKIQRGSGVVPCGSGGGRGRIGPGPRALKQCLDEADSALSSPAADSADPATPQSLAIAIGSLASFDASAEHHHRQTHSLHPHLLESTHNGLHQQEEPITRSRSEENMLSGIVDGTHLTDVDIDVSSLSSLSSQEPSSQRAQNLTPSPQPAQLPTPVASTLPNTRVPLPAAILVDEAGQDQPEPALLSSQTSNPDLSDLASVASVSSKASTPLSTDNLKERPTPTPIIPTTKTTTNLVPPSSRPLRKMEVEIPAKSAPPVARRRYDVRPKASIPTDMSLPEYALQCIAAAELSRLNPYALHHDEYLMLRDHISHAQVTTYLNIRNGILRLWIRNPQIAVTRDEAVGCAKDSRWFHVASVCFDWLARRGYINFGCVQVKPSRKNANKSNAEPDKTYGSGKQKTVVVIGAGMAGLGCARQLEGLFAQYARHFRERGEEPPRVVLVEGRNRVGGRIYSRQLATNSPVHATTFRGVRHTAEMGAMIITGFERGNPLNVLVRGQLGLPYHILLPDTTLYDTNGKPVDMHRDTMVEGLFNDCLDRVSEYKFLGPASKLIEGNRELMEEGKDSFSEATKTIRQAEELAAAQPHAPPVAQQSMTPQVNLVPVSSERTTGRVHTEPGKPGAIKAAPKAKLMGWALRDGVSDEADLDLEPATKEPGATLGSVTDHAITQYKAIVDLNAQDHRLLNWHVANLEYSNATNWNQLSLQGWDIDAGNEWEGKHTVVVGGYQGVPRGIQLCPSPLDLRQQWAVSKITYTAGSQDGAAVVECENGQTVEADFVVNTIPLGVLKRGNIEFDPPLPSWKTEAIGRLGFGVLNKVVMVYRKPFWNEDRDIFGVLRGPPNRHSLNQRDYGCRRGRFFQWFNISHSAGLPALLALMAGDAGFDTEQTSNDDLVAEATDILRGVYGKAAVPARPVETIVTRWASDRFARGSYSSAGPNMQADDYATMARPIGNLFFAGEHTSGTHPATVHGAYLTGLRAASDVLDAMLGPIPIPTPLVVPRGTSSSLLKRKAAEALVTDPVVAHREAHENRMWDHVIAKIGLRPVRPAKPAMSGYLFFSKSRSEEVRRRCESGSGSRAVKRKSRPGANDVRVMSAKMWRDATPETKKPFEALAEEQKRAYTKGVEEWTRRAAEWDEKMAVIRADWEKDNPYVPLLRPAAVAAAAAASAVAGDADKDGGYSSAALVGGSELDGGAEGGRQPRRRKVAAGTFAETDTSDVEMGEA